MLLSPYIEERSIFKDDLIKCEYFQAQKVLFANKWGNWEFTRMSCGLKSKKGDPRHVQYASTQKSAGVLSDFLVGLFLLTFKLVR